VNITKESIIQYIKDDEVSATEIDFVEFISNNFINNDIYYAYNINEHSFYKYSKSLKFWKKTKNEEVEKQIWITFSKTVISISHLKYNLYEINKSKSNFIFYMTLEKMRTIVKSFAMVVPSMPDSTSATYIPLLNGYVDFETLEFKSLDKNIFNRYVLPFEYKEMTKKPELFLKFIEQIQPKEEHQKFLINWLAYLLIPSNPRQKSLFMLGSGQNGKGVLTRVMTALLGQSNTTSLTIPQITAENYHIATIVNSLVNFSPDNDPNDKLHVGTFKSLTGGDNMTVRNIRGEPFEMNFLGKLVFSVNKMPYFSSKDSAVLRRVEVLQFPVIISEKNKIENLEKKLLRDGNEIFMFLLNRARDLSKNSFRFSTPTDIAEYSRLTIEENDSVFDFLEDLLLRIEQKREVYKYNELYKEYKEHCMQSTFKPLNKVSFKDSLLMHSIKREDIQINFKRSGEFGNHFEFLKLIAEIPIFYETIEDEAENLF